MLRTCTPPALHVAKHRRRFLLFMPTSASPPATVYYGRFYRSALTPVLRHLERALVRWACRKYKRFRGHVTNAAHWLGRVSRRDPHLFVLWQIGIRPATGS